MGWWLRNSFFLVLFLILFLFLVCCQDGSLPVATLGMVGGGGKHTSQVLLKNGFFNRLFTVWKH